MEVFNNQLDVLTWAALGSTAIAWMLIVWAIGSVVVAPVVTRPGADPLERRRVDALRKCYPTYRWFEPMIVELAGVNQSLLAPSKREATALDLLVAHARLPWTPEEYLAIKQTESLLIALSCLALMLVFFNALISALVGLTMGLVSYAIAVVAIPNSAGTRRALFRRRLPHAIDVMALLLEAGSNFQDAVQVIAHENRNHPLGDEFGRVVQQMDLGRTRREALMSLKERIGDGDTGDLVFAICKGEELGTPLSAILKTQSEQMRLKRSQWGEKAAKEAEVKMTGPNLLIMIACVIVILGPILLPVLLGGGLGL